MLNLVCLLEEPSARNTLEIILEKILKNTNIHTQYIVFEGKQDLDKNVRRRIECYNVPNSVYLIMRDKDSGDCKKIKQELREKINETGKAEKTLIRIACHELEAFFLGDLQAVAKAFNLSLAKEQKKARYRSPDQISNPAEEIARLTKNEYQKISGSRAIAPYLKLDGTNKSVSFNALIDGIKKLCGD